MSEYKIPKKITLILDKSNHLFLNELQQNYDEDNDEKFSYGKVVNRCINFQRALSQEIKFELSEIFRSKINELYSKRKESSFDRSNYYNEKIAQYKELYTSICDEELDLDLETREWHQLKNGHAILPQNWIQLTEYGSLFEHESVLVVECRQGAKHGNVPHFFLASDCKDSSEITDELERSIYGEIKKVYKSFDDLRKRDIESSKNMDSLSNSEALLAWSQEPHFNIYVIPEENDPACYNPVTRKYEYPAGAYIVRE